MKKEDLSFIVIKNLKSTTTTKRALEIVEMYLKRKHPKCKIIKLKKGPDLQVIFSNGKAVKIEVKGTNNINPFIDIKVSGKDSYIALKRAKIDLYRVTNIWKNPELYILKEGIDYILTPEPRWRGIKIKRLGAVVECVFYKPAFWD